MLVPQRLGVVLFEHRKDLLDHVSERLVQHVHGNAVEIEHRGASVDAAAFMLKWTNTDKKKKKKKEK